MKRRSRHRTSNVLDNLRHDLKHDVRRLLRSPAFTLVSVLSLAFGIAGATAFFSVVNATLFRPAPHVQRPEELVAIYTSDSTIEHGPLSYPDVADIRRQADTLEDVAAKGWVDLSVGPPGHERQLKVSRCRRIISTCSA